MPCRNAVRGKTRAGIPLRRTSRTSEVAGAVRRRNDPAPFVLALPPECHNRANYRQVEFFASGLKLRCDPLTEGQVCPDWTFGGPVPKPENWKPTKFLVAGAWGSRAKPGPMRFFREICRRLGWTLQRCTGDKVPRGRADSFAPGRVTVDAPVLGGVERVKTWANQTRLVSAGPMPQGNLPTKISGHGPGGKSTRQWLGAVKAEVGRFTNQPLNETPIPAGDDAEQG